MSRGRWGSYYDVPPRRAVEGGVVVAKPGKVSDPLAVDLVAAAEMESAPQILARGRTYARAGQVVAVQAEPECFSAQIQGTGAAPYEVRLDRTTISGSDRVAADCTCPYGCDDGWCKHAAALAYVAAYLLDRDPGTRATWTGQQPATGSDTSGGSIPGSIANAAVVPASTLTLGSADLAALRSPIRDRDGRQLLAAGEALVPHPWRVGEPDANADS
ncbi:MAG TPA: SWIM zinc finger family protein [Motilibacterales bacterium]|nr:SWIM zinc finger family protein [Motilibacterales bacterium]